MRSGTKPGIPAPREWAADPRISLHSLGVLVGSALVKNQLCGVALCIRYKGDLGIDDLGDEIMIAFREYFDLSLPGCLGHEMIAFPRDFQDDLRRQLIAAHVAVEYFRIDLRLLALRGKHHASAVSKDMQIRRDLLRRRAIDIREHDYREFVVGIVGQHRIEAFYSASVRNFCVAIRGAYAQAKSVVVFEWRGHLL